MRIALDTNVFIYVFEEHPVWGEKAKKLLQLIESGKYEAVVSALTLTELLVKPIREGNRALEKQYKLLFSHFPHLQMIPLDSRVAESAAYIRGIYNVKTPDAIVVASAIAAGAGQLITQDLRLQSIREISCIDLESLQI